MELPKIKMSKSIKLVKGKNSMDMCSAALFFITQKSQTPYGLWVLTSLIFLSMCF